MPHAILASLTGLGGDRAVLETAIAAAQTDGGHVTCLHARVDAVETATMIEVVYPQRHDHGDVLRLIGREQAQRETDARAAFEEAVVRHGLALSDEPGGGEGLSISWQQTRSFFSETPEEARYHDLTVMSREAELSAQRIKQVLLQSGRPLLLAPPRPLPTLGRAIAIAWKAGAEAARAVTAASSLLARAERVFVLAVSANDDERDRLSAERLARGLGWRGIKAEIRMEHAPEAEARKLAAMAYGCEADLLVMGAYGRNRLREYVLGGVTESMLKDCAIPVLMVR